MYPNISSLTPAVILRCAIPDNIEKSFVRGTVTVSVRDSAFLTSSPFRHAAMLSKVYGLEDAKVLLKFTDGGIDQHNMLEAVKCANICIFRELDQDMLVHARCAPGHSYTNPADSIMSILYLALQNSSLERVAQEDEVEKKFRACNSVSAIRAVGQKSQDFKESWQQSIEPVHSTVRNRFMRLKLKEEPVQAIDPIGDQDIDLMKRHLQELFPSLDLSRLQKAHSSKIERLLKMIGET